MDYADLLAGMSPKQRLDAAVAQILQSGLCSEQTARRFIEGLTAQAGPGQTLAQGGGPNEILVYGEITGSDTNRILAELLGVELKDNSAASINSQLARLDGDVLVRIHSYGGCTTRARPTTRRSSPTGSGRGRRSSRRWTGWPGALRRSFRSGVTSGGLTRWGRWCSTRCAGG